MKAITLWDPWASLIVAGVKKIETRSWYTKYRGPLAIHAAKRKPFARDLSWLDLSSLQADLSRVIDSGKLEDLPRGCVIGVCELVDCVPVEDIRIGISEVEAKYGDYASGYWAWILENVRQIEPVPVRGYQGLWNWDKKDMT